MERTVFNFLFIMNLTNNNVTKINLKDEVF